MWLFVLPLAVVILDQFSKYIVVENWEKAFPLLKKFFI